MGAPRVAVVGAGLAGLAAGVELKAAGAAVEVFERSRLLGGRATSFVMDGEEVDNGQHVFLGCFSEFLGFVRLLGMAGQVHLQERFDVVVFAPGRPPGRLRAAGLPAPWHLAAALAGYRPLGWRDKLRVARAFTAAGRAGRAGGREGGEVFADWLRRHGQSEAIRRAFWDPFFVPALNAPLEAVTTAEAAFVMTTAFMSDAGAARFGYLTVPLARLAERAAARLDAVHVRSAVARVGPACVETADGRRLPFDGVVVAVPPAQVARLGLPPAGGFVSRPIVDVHLWHDAGPLGFDLAALLESPVQWVFEKAPGYLCCSMSNAGRMAGWPESDLVELCWGQLSGSLPGLAGAQLRRGAATRSPEATYGGARRPGPVTPIPNVALAGSWTDTGWPDTMESAVRSGRAAARLLLARLGLEGRPGEAAGVA